MEISRLNETKGSAVRLAFAKAGQSPVYLKKHLWERLPELFLLKPESVCSFPQIIRTYYGRMPPAWAEQLSSPIPWPQWEEPIVRRWRHLRRPPSHWSTCRRKNLAPRSRFAPSATYSRAGASDSHASVRRRPGTVPQRWHFELQLEPTTIKADAVCCFQVTAVRSPVSWCVESVDVWSLVH
jgi:hypothetical protein